MWNKLAMLVLSGMVVGCDSHISRYGLPKPRTYRPDPAYQQSYDLVHNHPCEESHHPAGQQWNKRTKVLEPKASFDVYYCEDIEGIIIVREEK